MDEIAPEGIDANGINSSLTLLAMTHYTTGKNQKIAYAASIGRPYPLILTLSA
jgi:hypothetical protein